MSQLYKDFGSTDCPKNRTMSTPLGLNERKVLFSKYYLQHDVLEDTTYT